MLSPLASVCLRGVWGWGPEAAGTPTACLYQDFLPGPASLVPSENGAILLPLSVSLPSDYGNRELSVLWSDCLLWWNIQYIHYIHIHNIYVKYTYNIKLTILTIFKYTFQWRYYIHPAVQLSLFHSQNTCIIPNRSSTPYPLNSNFSSPPLLGPVFYSNFLLSVSVNLITLSTSCTWNTVHVLLCLAYFM